MLTAYNYYAIVEQYSTREHYTETEGSSIIYDLHLVNVAAFNKEFFPSRLRNTRCKDSRESQGLLLGAIELKWEDLLIGQLVGQ